MPMVTAATKLKDAFSLEEKLDNGLKTAETSLCRQKSIQSKLWFFQESCMDVRVCPLKRLSTEELMLLKSGAGEDS